MSRLAAIFFNWLPKNIFNIGKSLFRGGSIFLPWSTTVPDLPYLYVKTHNLVKYLHIYACLSGLYHVKARCVLSVCTSATTTLLVVVCIIALLAWYSGRQTNSVRNDIRECVRRQQYPCPRPSGNPPWQWADCAKLLDKIKVTGKFLGGQELLSAIRLGYEGDQIWVSGNLPFIYQKYSNAADVICCSSLYA